MFMVYWTVTNAQGAHPHAQAFASTDMLSAMALMEQLRTRQHAGEPLAFITMSSQNPDSVGKPGVDVVGPGYKWTKRRNR